VTVEIEIKKHFVQFFSPGTFVPETTTNEIEKWDVPTAIEMAKNITERYGAKPYGFRFLTRSRSAEELDSKVTDTSPTYYLGGRVMTLDEVKQEMPDEKILISNMVINKIERVIVNDNSWRFTGELRKDDIVLNVTL
jgi:hypothetical protein